MSTDATKTRLHPRPARVLYLSECGPDHAKIRTLVASEGLPISEFALAESHDAFESAITHSKFDLVVVAYRGAQSLRELELTHSLQPDAPIIVVSDNLSEDQIVDCLHAGATDYVLTRNIGRLGQCAWRAVTDRQNRRRRLDDAIALGRYSTRFRSLTEHARDVAWIASLVSGQFLYMSPSVSEILGILPEQLFDDPGSWLGCLHPEDRHRIASIASDLSAGRIERFETEFRLVHRDGRERWIIAIGNVTGDATSRWRVVRGLARDITEQKNSDRAIQESERRFRSTFEQSAVGIAFIDHSHNFIRVNHRYQEILGYKRGELGPDFVSTKSWDNPETVFVRRKKLFNDEVAATRSLERLIRPDGARIWCQVTESVVEIGPEGEHCIMSVVEDVTEQIRTEEQLRQSERLFRSTVNNMVEGVMVRDSEGRIVAVNRTVEQVAGSGENCLIGRPFEDLPWDAIREDGTRIPPDEWPSSIAARTGEAQKNVVIGVRNRAGTLRWVSVNAQPIELDTSRHRFVVSTFNDITDRKKAEEEIRTLNAGLERAVAERTKELLAAYRELEAFSYSVSHDLRAPLNALRGFAKLVLESGESRLHESNRYYIERIAAAGTRLDTLIEDILSLSRVSRAELTLSDIDLSALACSIFEEIRESEPERMYRLSVQPDMRCIADSRLLRIALTNLLSNAWKFTRDRVPAIIEVSEKESDPGMTGFLIRDNGAGFDPRYADKLFGTFQRLHSESEFPGTGVGLAIVRRVVERHGGHVSADGRPGAGATFHVHLPKRPEFAGAPVMIG